MHISAVPTQYFVVPYFPAAHSQDISRTNILPEDRVVPLISETQQAEIEDLKFARKDLLSFKRRLYNTLNFTVDEKSGERVIQVINPSTDALVRQISMTDILASRYQGNIVGYFLSAQA